MSVIILIGKIVRVKKKHIFAIFNYKSYRRLLYIKIYNERIIPFLLSVSLLYSCHQEEEISLPTDGPVINLAELGLSENDVVQGRMRIKLKEEPAGNLSEKSIEGGISARIK